MTTFERYLVKLDDWPLSVFWRVGLGLAIPPAFQLISGDRDAVWWYFGLFLVQLIALRVGPAVLRFTLRFSPEVKEIWRKRRFLAKAHDSFQWQKLLWLGLGMLPHALIGAGLGAGGTMLAAFCIISGGAGLAYWSTTGSPWQPLAVHKR